MAMKPRDGDRALEGALRRSLAVRRPADGDECPPADILAGYYERSLDKIETQQLDVHFSNCARCREQLDILARSEAPDENCAPRKAWIWNWRWLAPVVAAATVAVLWVGIREGRRTRTEETQIVAENRAPLNAPARELEPPSPSERPPQPKFEQPSPPLQSAVRPDEKTLARPTPNLTNDAKRDREPTDQLSRQSEEARGGAAGVPAARNETSPAVPTEKNAARLKEIPEQSRAAAAPPPAAKPTPASNAPADSGAASSAAQTAAVPPASETVEAQKSNDAISATAQPEKGPPPANAIGSTALQESAVKDKKSKQGNFGGHVVGGAGISGAVSGGMMAKAAKTAASNPFLIVTPDRTVVWRILPAGGVELSSDGGSTWQPQTDVPVAMWVSGSAPSAKICWIVGQGGAVIRTANAHTWKTIEAPTSQDLIAVSAQSAKSATITAADGTRYKTSDGGRNWQPSKDAQP